MGNGLSRAAHHPHGSPLGCRSRQEAATEEKDAWPKTRIPNIASISDTVTSHSDSVKVWGPNERDESPSSSLD